MYAYIKNNTFFVSAVKLPTTIVVGKEEVKKMITQKDIEGNDVAVETIDFVDVLWPNPIIQWHTEIEYSDSINDPTLENWKIIQRPNIESAEDKFRRVFSNLVALEVINETTSPTILEGVVFTHTQMGDLIVARLFKDPITGNPNPHGQIAMFAKMFAGNKDPQFLAYVQDRTLKTNQILAFFQMSAL